MMKFLKVTLLTLSLSICGFTLYGHCGSCGTGDEKHDGHDHQLPSPIVDAMKGKTVVMKNGHLRNGKVKPDAEYYAIYYSAHWCPPCRKFTPKLAAFYKEHHNEHSNFEVIFVSSDRSENAMEEYMEWGDMQFPALKYKKKAKTKQMTQYAGNGIPQLVLVNRAGEVIADSYVDGDYVGPYVVLDKLKELMK